MGTFVTQKAILPAIIFSLIAVAGFCGPCATPSNKSSVPGVNHIHGRCAPYITEAKEAPAIRSSGQAHYLKTCGKAPYQRTKGEAPYQKTCGEAHFIMTVGQARFVKCSGMAPYIMTICDPSGPVRQAKIPSCR